jgi:4-hydroxymandelate oxidase
MTVGEGSEPGPICVADFEPLARARLAPEEFEILASFAPGNETLRRTPLAYDALALRTRVLPGADVPDPSVSVLGQRLSVPFMLAPAGYHTRAHPDGELASARAAAASGTVLVVATNSGHPTEAVAAAAEGPKWFQTYFYRDRDHTLDLVRRAEDCGFVAVCMTLDCHWPAKRQLARRARVHPAAPEATPDERGRARSRVLGDPRATWSDPAASWTDVTWLKERTRLPIVCKGIMTAEDADCCVASGADALIVSNHGGRLGNTLASIEVLPEVVAAVDGRVEVYLDGGIRRGADVVRALALGAKAVLLGRPLFWGLADGGEAGLLRLLDLLREELEMTMMLCGRPSVADIDASTVTVAPSLGNPLAR